MTFSHHIFVDYENVREIDLSLIAEKPVRLTLVVGLQQKTLPLDLVKRLLELRQQVTLVEAGVSGHNALDLVLGYLVGRESAVADGVQFAILSKDKGFDALIRHLNQNGIRAERYEQFASIPVIKPPGRAAARPRHASTPEDRADLIARHLAAQGAGRPKRRKTLASHINGRFDKQLSEAEIEVVLDILARRGVIATDANGWVTYPD